MFGQLVADYMTPSAALITLKPDMALKDAAQLLLDSKVTGAPVVEDGTLAPRQRAGASLHRALLTQQTAPITSHTGVLVGVLSRTDLLYKLAGLRSLHVAGQGARSLRYMENTQRLMKVEAVLVRDAMSTNPISLTPQVRTPPRLLRAAGDWSL